MQRPIYYKVWSFVTKTMSPVVSLRDMLATLGLTEEEEMLGMWSEKHCHFLEWSGCFDRKGNKVFEGDIIKGKFKDSKDKELIEMCPNIDKGFHWYDELQYMDFEVVGTFYENPELLK